MADQGDNSLRARCKQDALGSIFKKILDPPMGD
jgi:hypothetical protein